MTGAELLDELTAQESRLIFDSFGEDTVGTGGRPARGRASRRPAGGDLDPSQRSVPLPCGAAGGIRGQRRLARAQERRGRPLRALLATCGRTVQGRRRIIRGGLHLDPSDYAAHGGAFPILVRGTGCVGSVAVSGLPQLQDHQLVVNTLEGFLAARR